MPKDTVLTTLIIVKTLHLIFLKLMSWVYPSRTPSPSDPSFRLLETFRVLLLVLHSVVTHQWDRTLVALQIMELRTGNTQEWGPWKNDWGKFDHISQCYWLFQQCDMRYIGIPGSNSPLDYSFVEDTIKKLWLSCSSFRNFSRHVSLHGCHSGRSWISTLDSVQWYYMNLKVSGYG